MSGERPRPCPRCGILKGGRPNTLCRDCRYTLSNEENAIWKDQMLHDDTKVAA